MSDAQTLDKSQFIEFDFSNVPTFDPTRDFAPISWGNERLLKPSKPGPRNLRDVIPAGKGRVSTDEYLDRIVKNQRCGMQSMLRLVDCEHSRDWQKPAVVCIIGGGPTLQDEVGELRRLVKRGAKVIAVNKSHDWLLKRGLPCHYAALLDPKDWVAKYIDLGLAAAKDTRKRAGKLWDDPKYLIASQCHDDTINKFKDRKDAYLWHAGAGVGESKILREQFANEEWCSLNGASVIGLRAIVIGYGLGFREFHLFGIDGSAKPPAPGSKTPQMYSYDKPHIDPTWKQFEVKLNSGWTRHYLANHHMARSTYEFEDSMREWDKQIKDQRMEFFNVRVHGDPEHSAIAMIAAGMGIHADEAENEKYGRSP